MKELFEAQAIRFAGKPSKTRLKFISDTLGAGVQMLLQGIKRSLRAWLHHAIARHLLVILLERMRLDFQVLKLAEIILQAFKLADQSAYLFRWIQRLEKFHKVAQFLAGFTQFVQVRCW